MTQDIQAPDAETVEWWKNKFQIWFNAQLNKLNQSQRSSQRDRDACWRGYSGALQSSHAELQALKAERDRLREALVEANTLLCGIPALKNSERVAKALQANRAALQPDTKGAE